MAADGPVLLGAVYNLSGPQAAFDQPSSRGAELARANAVGIWVAARSLAMTSAASSRISRPRFSGTSAGPIAPRRAAPWQVAQCSP
jgi:hypothetical protein